MNEPAVSTPENASDGPIIRMDSVNDPTAPPGEETPQAAVAPAGEVEIQCPGCGLTVLGERPRPTAAWFCPRCDYPLFWAAEPPERPHAPSRAARRRLPGTGGRETIGAEPCWHCGEMSEPGDTECGRCAATLPKPRAPRVRVPEPVPVPIPVPVRSTTWPFLAAAGLAGAAVATAVTSWLSGA